MMQNACCFFGHRQISESEKLEQQLYITVENLIVNEKIDTFLFGSKSKFNDLCKNVLIKIKEKYPHIKRVYVRAEFPYIDTEYKAYLLTTCDDTYYPEEIVNSGRAVYVKRNCYMINKSRVCIIYYDDKCLPTKRKSGTKIALDYAIKNKKEIILLPQ